MASTPNLPACPPFPQQIAIDLPKPHTPATVAEWAEEMLPDFIKQEKEMRLAAEKVAAEKEAKRLAERNVAKVRLRGGSKECSWRLLQEGGHAGVAAAAAYV